MNRKMMFFFLHIRDKFKLFLKIKNELRSRLQRLHKLSISNEKWVPVSVPWDVLRIAGIFFYSEWHIFPPIGICHFE